MIIKEREREREISIFIIFFDNLFLIFYSILKNNTNDKNI